MTQGVQVRGHMNGCISIHDSQAGTETWLTPRQQGAYEAWLAEQPKEEGR